MSAYADLLQFLEQSSLAVSIRQSYWLYPFLEIIHIIGIILLVGPAFMFDIRILGYSKHLPVKDLERYLLPWAERALLLVIPSGFLLFITNAGELGYDPVFWIKMSLLILAGSNALYFHRVVVRTINDDMTTIPFAAKLIAVFSLILWTAVITCGRLLAY